MGITAASSFSAEQKSMHLSPQFNPFRACEHTDSSQPPMRVKPSSKLSSLVKITAGLAGLAALARPVDSMCVCSTVLSKHYNSDKYSSAKKIIVRNGCEDTQLKVECDSVKREIEDFISAAMENLDDLYVRFMTPFITAKFQNGDIDMSEVHLLRDVLESHRLVALDDLEDRVHPHCANGLFTETLYNTDNVKYSYADWDNWDLNDMRNQMLCVSETLLDTLQQLKDGNQVNQALRIDTALDFNAEFNEQLEEIIAADTSGNRGLSPYTKRVMDKVISQINDGDNIGLLGTFTK